MTNDSFLIKLDDLPTFLTALRNGKPYGSSFPTQGLTMSFDAATEICVRLREQGYDAVVVDRFGQPPTAADLAAVKRSVEYQVIFHSRYFCGQNANKQDLGSTDRRKAVNMSQAAALVVCQRLQKRGFADAAIIERSSLFVDVNDELRSIWPEEFQANSNS
jgi:hypothetical protein